LLLKINCYASCCKIPGKLGLVEFNIKGFGITSKVGVGFGKMI